MRGMVVGEGGRSSGVLLYINVTLYNNLEDPHINCCRMILKVTLILERYDK